MIFFKKFFVYLYILKFNKNIDKPEKTGYNNNRKRQDLKRLCQSLELLLNNHLGRGGYFAVMVKIISITIITKIATSNFFAINAMLTFHKHPLLS